VQDTLGKKQSILTVGAQHGDEKLGPLVWQHLNKHRPDLLTSVDYICGNPKAVSKNIRYIESDLNRSYSPSKSSNLSYEEKRAQEILGFIRSGC
jgi:succinylglutamate desuccinylase